MRRLTRYVVLSGCLLLLPAAAPGGDQPLLSVGQSHYTVAEVQTWLQRSVRWAQVKSAGSSGTALHDALKAELVSTALWHEHAQKSVPEADLKAQRDQLLSVRLERELSASQSVTDEEIAAFYAQHAARYQSPRAIALWRILVADEATARDLLARWQTSAKSVQVWSNLAREHSLDEATKQRNGNLGFVRADGSTDVPQVRVNQALFDAADQVRDGQLVLEPVAEGTQFAVVWRRGTRAALERSLSTERDNIRQILVRTKAQQAQTQLLNQLRAEHLKQHAPEHLQALPSP